MLRAADSVQVGLYQSMVPGGVPDRSRKFSPAGRRNSLNGSARSVVQGMPDAYRMPRIIAGRPERYECRGCGWWQSKDAYDAATERILGLDTEGA